MNIAKENENQKGNGNENDLELIKQLEKEIGHKLPHRDFSSIISEAEPGFAVDRDNPQQITVLNLSKLNLTSIPVAVARFEHLEILNLDKNEISDISPLAGLTKLKQIYCSYNHVSDLSPLAGLTKLTQIYCSYNQIRDISHLAGLINLSRLGIKDNQVSDLSPLTKLFKLEALNINYNQVSDLSPLTGLTNLKQLWIANNQVGVLPKEIANLKKLEILALNNNNLTHLAREIGGLEELWALSLEGNENLVSPPPAVVKEGIKAIKNYFRALAEKKRVWTSKMVIVGEGGVGKTCLLDALQDKAFQPGKDTTHGIDIRTLSLPCPSKDDNSSDNEDTCMELRVWDFGGQEIYHATHQFYMSNHALFILVWNARLGYEAGNLYKWLETIKALAPGSPVLVVATCTKERGADLPKGDILSLYPHVLFFEIDNKNKKGIAELQDAIARSAAKLKNMGIERPKAWVDAAARVQKEEEKYLSKQKLFHMFAAAGVEKENFESLAVYLHELGDILYYPDEAKLEDTVIIKPAWVSSHIARILDSEEVSKQGGFLPKKLMQQLWQDLPPLLQERFVTLMERFDLSYQTDSPQEISLIVEKLKYEEHPDYKRNWEEFTAPGATREIVFKYELDTIPAGIPTWFIARTHRFSLKTHWRNGAVLQDKEGNHRGLVLAKPENKEVWLRVKGAMPYYFFAQLRDTLEFTFDRFEGLQRTVKVPCPGHKRGACQHFFKLENLENRLKRNKTTIQCPEAIVDEDVDIMKMLFGISFAPKDLHLVEQITSHVKLQIEAHDKKMKTALAEQANFLTEQNRELIKFIQLEFIKSYEIQHKIKDQTCPNVFTLKPKKKNFFAKGVNVDDFELCLYCQYPGAIHPVKPVYDVKIAKDWFIAIAPYYNKMLKILKWLAPLSTPLSETFLDKDVLKEITTSTGGFFDHLGESGGMKFFTIDNTFREKDANSELLTLDGSELRMFRQLLEKIDPAQNWGGLQRVVTPEGHILWLCKEHAAEYK